MTDETMKMLIDTMEQLMKANKDKYDLQNGLLQILTRVCNLAVPLDRNELIEIINKSLKYDRNANVRKEVIPHD
jgi:hypothetical protein